ncbi:MAG: ComEC/Rec2 family competence protein [Bdellovibrionota bacterium]
MWIWIWAGLLLGSGFIVLWGQAFVWLAMVLGFLITPFPRLLFFAGIIGSLLFLFKFEFIQKEALRPEQREIESLMICGISQTRFGSIVQPKSDLEPDLNSYQFYAPEFLKSGDCVIRDNVSLKNLSSQERSFYPSDELRRELKGPKAALKYSKAQIKHKQETREVRSKSLSESWRRAVVEGRIADLPRETWEKGQFLGIAHLFVVSGLHIGFLFLVISVLFSKIFRFSSLVSCILSAVFMLIYIVFFDLGLPAWRAFSFFAIGSLFYQFFPPIRRYPMKEVCAFVGILFFVWEPLLAMTPTYILSFGVSFSLIWARSIKWAPISASLSAACLCAFLGFPSSVLSPLWNLLFVPIFSFLIFPALGLQSFLPALESFSSFLIQRFSLLIDLCFSISKVFGSFHLSADEAGVMWLGLLFVTATKQKKDQWLGISIWALLASFTLFLPAANQGKNFVETIDVGQGDAHWLRLGGKNILIDGGKSLGLEKELRARSIDQIDLWILTHFDDDHFAAFQSLSYKFDVKRVWIPRLDLRAKSKFLRSEFGNRIQLAKGSELRANYEAFELIGSAFGSNSPFRDVKNQDSLIVELHAHGQLIGLFLGDALKKQEKLWLKAQKKDLSSLKFLKLGHHGSNTSSSAALIQSLRPKLALISVGRGNSYQFPRGRVLDRLESVGATILRTDTHGSFSIHLDD